MCVRFPYGHLILSSCNGIYYIFTVVGVKFSLINILLQFVRPIDELSTFLNPFILRTAFFAYFR